MAKVDDARLTERERRLYEMLLTMREAANNTEREQSESRWDYETGYASAIRRTVYLVTELFTLAD